MIEPVPHLADVPFGAAREGTDATVFECGLCGLRFSHGEQACGGCPLGAGCDLVKCPGCGYQFPRASRIVLLYERLRARLRTRA